MAPTSAADAALDSTAAKVRPESGTKRAPVPGSFIEMMQGCTISAVHLEMRDAYTPKDPDYLRWQAGDHFDPAQRPPWNSPDPGSTRCCGSSRTFSYLPASSSGCADRTPSRPLPPSFSKMPTPHGCGWANQVGNASALPSRRPNSGSGWTPRTARPAGPLIVRGTAADRSSLGAEASPAPACCDPRPAAMRGRVGPDSAASRGVVAHRFLRATRDDERPGPREGGPGPFVASPARLAVAPWFLDCLYPPTKRRWFGRSCHSQKGRASPSG